MNHLKQLVAAAIVVTTGFSVNAAAEEGSSLSANIGLTSNYVFRGVSLTDDSAAVFGGVDYEHGDGVYFGAWASNLTDGQYELDLYAGFSSQIGEVAYDIGYVRYKYPNSDNADYGEAYFSLAFSMVEVGAAYTIDSEINDGTGSAFVEGDIYYYAAVAFDLDNDWSVSATIGTYTFEDDDLSAQGFDYSHGQIDVTKSIGEVGDFTFSLSITDEMNAVSDEDDVIPYVSWVKVF